MIGALRDLSRSLLGQSILIAIACLAADLAPFLSDEAPFTMRPQDWVVLVGIVAVDAALALPAQFSGWVAVVHTVLLLGAAWLTGGVGIGGDANDAGFLIAAYRAGAWLHGWAAWTAVAVLALGAGGVHLLPGVPAGDSPAIEILKNAILPWLVGRYTTARRGYISELERRAENQRRDAKEAVDHAVAKERSAIARDLHDVISHHVSAIGIHAGAARLGLTTTTRPDGMAETLTAVETASRAAMLDLRRLLDLLHGDRTASTRQPGLDDLDDLLEGIRRAGLPTRLSTHGAARPLPGSIDIALYRITQEMLTNALRHGDRVAVDVEVEYRDASVSVIVRNGMPALGSTLRDEGQHARSPDDGARGLAGIRKRAALFGGTISYGPDPAGRRWETSTTFPLGEDR